MKNAGRVWLVSLLILLWVPVKNSFAQETVIKVMDAKSGETIPYANITFRSLLSDEEQATITGLTGVAKIPIHKPGILNISYVGYHALHDTILPGKHYSFELTPRIFDLDEVIVTGSAKPSTVDQSIYNIRVLSRREIELKGATDMTDMLSKEINLRINQDPVLGSGLTIRGLSGNNIKILIDGVPVIGRMAGNIDLSQLDVRDVDHVEMVEGPMSTIYGSNALAGVINIITRVPDKKKWSANVNTYYESVGQYNTGFRLSTRKKKHFLGITFDRRFFEGFSLNDSLRSQLWKPKEQYHSDLTYGFTAGKTDIRIQASLMRERLLQRGNLLPPYFEKAFDSWFYTFRTTNRIQAKTNLSNRFTVQTLLSYSFYNRRKETWFKDLTTLNKVLSENGADQDTTTFHALALRSIAEYTFLNHIIFQGGIDINYEKGYGKRIDQGSRSIGDYAAFITGRIPLLAGLELQPGLRAAYNTDFTVPLVPSLNLKWSPKKKLNFRLSYARGYRAPSLKEMYIYFVDINHNILPNPSLKPEYGNSYNFTSELNTELKPKIHYSDFKVNLFFNNLSNIIKLAKRPLENQLVYQYINIDYYRTVGGSLQFRYHFYPNFRFSLGFGTTGTSFAFEQAHPWPSNYTFSQDINSNVEWMIKKAKITLSAFYKYTGNAVLFEIDEDNHIQKGTIADYHTLDISIQKSILKSRLRILAGGKNLFNNTNIETTGDISAGPHSGSSGTAPVGWGRTFFVQLDFNLSKR